MTDKPTPTTDLLKRCAEIYEWRSTGVLSGEALRDYAKRKWPDLHDTLQMAEHETVTEALALLAKWGQPAPATQQAAPKAAPGDVLDEALRERDDAEDFIDALLDEVLGHERPEWSSSYGHADALNDVQERMTALHKPAVDKAWGRFQSAMAAPQQEAQPNYVVSLVVVKEIPTGVNTQNKLYTVNAASADEAVGKAVLQMPNDFPEHRLHTACFVATPAQPAPQQEAQEPATVDQKTMEIAESVGLIGPASRVGDLHAAIQRFHDLICVNATIKAAVMAAEAIGKQQAAHQQEAQEPVAYVHVPHYTVEGKVRPVVSFEKYQQDYDDGIYSTRIPLYTAPQPAPAPLSEMPYEKRKAIQDGEQISASDAWFKARHEMLDTVDRRNVFRAGFDRGWNAAIAAQGEKDAG